MTQPKQAGRRPIGHLSPKLDGPACGVKGQVLIHQPGVTRMCEECAGLLENPNSAMVIVKEARLREWLDLWVDWATGHGGRYPAYCDYLPGESESKPELSLAITTTVPGSRVTFQRARFAGRDAR